MKEHLSFGHRFRSRFISGIFDAPIVHFRPYCWEEGRPLGCLLGRGSENLVTLPERSCLYHLVSQFCGVKSSALHYFLTLSKHGSCVWRLRSYAGRFPPTPWCLSQGWMLLRFLGKRGSQLRTVFTHYGRFSYGVVNSESTTGFVDFQRNLRSLLPCRLIFFPFSPEMPCWLQVSILLTLLGYVIIVLSLFIDKRGTHGLKVSC